jgi:hypothetical protein
MIQILYAAILAPHFFISKIYFDFALNVRAESVLKQRTNFALFGKIRQGFAPKSAQKNRNPAPFPPHCASTLPLQRSTAAA